MMSLSMTSAASSSSSISKSIRPPHRRPHRVHQNSPRRGVAVQPRVAFFDRFTKRSTPTGDDDAEDEDDAVEAVDETFEETTQPSSKFNGKASFGAIFDKIKTSVSQTIDLDEVEVVEEDVIERPKENTKNEGGFGAILRKQAERAERQRALLNEDYERGEAAVTRVRADRSAGGSPVAAFTGGEVGNGTWTLKPVSDEGSQGKKLPTITVKRGETKIIGRTKGPGVDVVVALPCVSSIHMQLETEGNKLFARDLGSTNGTYVEGFEVKQKRRFRVFNGATVRLGAENFNGEPYATFKANLAGAKELEKDSEYGQLNYLMEVLGGPEVVVKFVGVNLAFQLVFFLLLQLNSN